MIRIGFIGLGIMGKPMAKNLLKAGYELVVYDVVAGPLAEVHWESSAPTEALGRMSIRDARAFAPNGAALGVSLSFALISVRSHAPGGAHQCGVIPDIGENRAQPGCGRLACAPSR